jgi:hypothetical protein
VPGDGAFVADFGVGSGAEAESRDPQEANAPPFTKPNPPISREPGMLFFVPFDGPIGPVFRVTDSSSTSAGR